MTTAQEADKKAADEAFSLRIDDYTLADAKGLAPPHISGLLRSARWAPEWNAALGRLSASRSNVAGTQAFKTRVNELRIEAAKAARQARILSQVQTESISDMVRNKIGDIGIPAGASLHEMQVLLSAQLIKEIRTLGEVCD